MAAPFLLPLAVLPLTAHKKIAMETQVFWAVAASHSQPFLNSLISLFLKLKPADYKVLNRLTQYATPPTNTT
jgi:hypothetical protein